MTVLVLDSGALSDLTTSPARLAALREQGLWPPHIPAAVLAEAPTGDHRQDFHTNWLVAACQVQTLTEPVAFAAAALRTRTGRAGEISAVDALVVAHAAGLREAAIVLTGDPRDIQDLATVSVRPVAVACVQAPRRRT